jgi:hypothetical protein
LAVKTTPPELPPLPEELPELLPLPDEPELGLTTLPLPEPEAGLTTLPLPEPEPGLTTLPLPGDMPEPEVSPLPPAGVPEPDVALPEVPAFPLLAAGPLEKPH